ncbi:MAG: hypothetical protein ACKVJE_00070 [Pseudomonadales bacterium]
MVLPISLIAQFIGMFLATKILQLNLNFIGITLLTFIPIALSHFVPGLAGFIVALVCMFITLKILDGSASLVKVVAILIISMAVQAALYKFVVNPSLTHAINNAESITIDHDGSMTIK